MVGVRGRASDRVNRGRLGPKNLFGWQANASRSRLTRPLVHRGSRLTECEHWRRLAETGWHYGLRRDGPSPSSSEPSEPSEPSTNDRHRAAEVLSRTPESVPELLRDLPELHLSAAGNSLHWVMLGQAAQGSKDTRLHDVVSFCRPRTVRQMHWSTTMIKNLSPQPLTAGDEQEG